MQKRSIVLLAAVLALVLLCSACGEKQDPIIGSWKSESEYGVMYLSFREDGTATASSDGGVNEAGWMSTDKGEYTIYTANDSISAWIEGNILTVNEGGILLEFTKTK